VLLYSFLVYAVVRVGGELHAPAAFSLEGHPISIVQEAWWAPGSAWTGAENLAPTGIRLLDRSARSASLSPAVGRGTNRKGCNAAMAGYAEYEILSIMMMKT
jgi:hypothetical protein